MTEVMQSTHLSDDLRSIPEVFPREFPIQYINDVQGWGIPNGLLHSKLEDGTYKLLTLDLDFGDTCSLSCPHCFRKSDFLQTGKPPLTLNELLSVIQEARELGLISVKFLGAGEPLEAPSFLELLEKLHGWGIKAAIFSKGYILGSDAYTEVFYGATYGIKKACDLISRLYDLNASILLGFNSFQSDVQEEFVGQRFSIIKNYVELRDRALRWLTEAGFNKYVPGKPTRLGLIAAPIKPENIIEIFTIYKWGRRRNMYPLSCPTTYSGLGRAEYDREKAMDFEAYVNALKKLYTDIYLWSIRRGIVDIEDFKRDGVALYPGCHPCDQVAAGMYLTLEGMMIRCPGRDDESCVEFLDVRERQSLKDLWMNSQNFKLAAQKDKLNFQCIARDGYFFREKHNFYMDIFQRIMRTLDE